MKFIPHFLIILSIFQIIQSVRFRSKKYCLPIKHMGPKKISYLSTFNSLTWEVKYHFSSKETPSNPFFNIFYPENDISCLTFRTKYFKDRGSLDIICGYSECRLTQFFSTPEGSFKFQPYADNPNCHDPWPEFHILSSDSRHLLLYGCYMQNEVKVEGAYLLTRVGMNFSQNFYKKTLKPVLLVANMKEFIQPDTESISYCNCSDRCQYYEFRSNCDLNTDGDENVDVNSYLLGAVIVLASIIAVAILYFIYHKYEEGFDGDDKEN